MFFSPIFFWIKTCYSPRHAWIDRLNALFKQKEIVCTQNGPQLCQKIAYDLIKETDKKVQSLFIC